MSGGWSPPYLWLSLQQWQISPFAGRWDFWICCVTHADCPQCFVRGGVCHVAPLHFLDDDIGSSNSGQRFALFTFMSPASSSGPVQSSEKVCPIKSISIYFYSTQVDQSTGSWAYHLLPHFCPSTTFWLLRISSTFKEKFHCLLDGVLLKKKAELT